MRPIVMHHNSEIQSTIFFPKGQRYIIGSLQLHNIYSTGIFHAYRYCTEAQYQIILHIKPASSHPHVWLLLPQIGFEESAGFFFIDNTSKVAYFLSTVCWTITFQVATTNMELISDQNAGNVQHV
jgi:hypothetical protein